VPLEEEYLYASPERDKLSITWHKGNFEMILESLDPHYRTSIGFAYLLLSSVKLDISIFVVIRSYSIPFNG
jgi:hypothetical protein